MAPLDRNNLVTFSYLLIISMLFLISSSFAFAAFPVEPILECVANNRDGTYTAYFGYNNQDIIDVVIPQSAIFPYNKIYGNVLDEVQIPEVFSPGVHTDFFSVKFDGTDIDWKLTGPDSETRTLTVTRSSKACDWCAGKTQPIVEIKKPEAGSALENPLQIEVEVTNEYPGDEYKAYGFFIYEDENGNLQTINIFSGLDASTINFLWSWKDQYPYLSDGNILVTVEHKSNGQLCSVGTSGTEPGIPSLAGAYESPAAPEFTTIGIIVGLLAVAAIYLLIIKKNKKR